MNLTPAERELVDIVAEDLRHIARESPPNCDDHQLRRISVQLRNLLVENRLAQCWNRLGLHDAAMVILAPKLLVDDLGSTDFAVAAGANVSGLHMSGINFRNRAMSAQELQEIYRKSMHALNYPFPLSEFIESDAIYTDGIIVIRRQLIKYVAHKKGGAHYDSRRKKDDQAYVALDNVMSRFTFGGDAIHNGTEGGKNAVYLELLSIGQQVVKSPDTKRFLSVAEIALR